VIAACGKRRRHSREQTAAFVLHGRSLAVARRLGPHHTAAERGRDGLVSEADPKGGNGVGEFTNRRHRHSRVLGSAGSGRENETRRLQRAEPGHVYLVVAEDADLFTKSPERLHEVEDERVVVVDDG
jgi:hypothetical protein